MYIALYHSNYNQEHLDAVQSEMVERGVPVIRAIWSECHGLWMAIEGCHRLRAAQALGITPIIKDITAQKTVSFQVDGVTVKERINDSFFEDLQNNACRTEILKFEEV